MIPNTKLQMHLLKRIMQLYIRCARITASTFQLCMRLLACGMDSFLPSTRCLDLVS